MDFAKMALFKSYAVIYLAIGAAIYEVLFVIYSYPNDDTETATIDRTVQCSDGYVDNGGLSITCLSEPVSVYDWLKNGFVTHEVKQRRLVLLINYM